MHSIQQCERRSVDSLSACLLNKPVNLSSEIKYTNFSLPVSEPYRKVPFIYSLQYCCSLLLFGCFGVCWGFFYIERKQKKTLESCFLSSGTTQFILFYIQPCQQNNAKISVALYFLKLLIFVLCWIFYAILGYYKIL